MSRRTQSGFTLVDMMVTIILISLVSLTLANFITTWLQSATLAQIRAELLGNAQSALDQITTDIKLSGSADQNNRWADDNAPGNQYGWQSNTQTLVLAKAATDSGQNVIFSDPAEYISQKSNQVYYLVGTTLYRRTIRSSDPADSSVTTCPPASATAACPADKTVATDVSNFAVQYFDSDDQVVAPAEARSIQLAITLARNQNGRTISANYDTRMVFRNE